jgi:hypothetical protein
MYGWATVSAKSQIPVTTRRRVAPAVCASNQSDSSLPDSIASNHVLMMRASPRVISQIRSNVASEGIDWTNAPRSS